MFLAVRSQCKLFSKFPSCWAHCAGAGAEPLIFEGAPCLGKDLSLPIWAFSARARSTAGSAPAAVSLSQPKVKPNLPASLLAPRVILQGVCATQQCKAPATHGHDTGAWTFPAGPHGLWCQGQLQGRACSQLTTEHCTDWPACLSMQQQPTHPQCLPEAPPPCNSASAAATSSSIAADSKAPSTNPDPSPSGMLCSDLQPRRALALLPFQGTGSSTAADSGRAEQMLQGSHAGAQASGPQMEAILCSDNQCSKEQSWNDGASWQACRGEAAQDVRLDHGGSVNGQMISLRGAEPEAGALLDRSRGAAVTMSLSREAHHEEMPPQSAQAAAETSGHEAELSGDVNYGYPRQSHAEMTERVGGEAEEGKQCVEQPGTPTAGLVADRPKLGTEDGAQWLLPAATLQQQAASLRCQVMHLSMCHTAAHIHNLMHSVQA